MPVSLPTLVSLPASFTELASPRGPASHACAVHEPSWPVAVHVHQWQPSQQLSAGKPGGAMKTLCVQRPCAMQSSAVEPVAASTVGVAAAEQPTAPRERATSPLYRCRFMRSHQHDPGQPERA